MVSFHLKPPSRFTAFFALLVVIVLCASAVEAQNQPPNRLTQVQAFLDQGDGQRALDALEPILKKDPKNGAAFLARSTAYFLVGELDRGSKDLDRALKLDPKLRQGWLNLGALRLSEGDGAGALTAFQQARQLDPAASENALNIGAVQLLLGNVGEANREFATYLAAVGDSAEANLLVAKNYALANVLPAATDHAARAIAADERVRLSMRTDPAFSLALDYPPFQALLEREDFSPPPGSLTVRHEISTPFETRRVAGAVIDALGALKIPFDPRVESTANWALVWSDKLRIKASSAGAATTEIFLIAPPKSHTRTSWQALKDNLFAQIEYQLAPKLPPTTARSGRG